MRALYIAAGACLLLALFFSGFTGAQQPQSQSTDITAAINQTAAYIQQVNQSAYLVFYPNLAKAYAYLGEAKSLSGQNQTQAFILLDSAMQAAQQQEQYLNSWRTASFAILSVAALCLAAIMYHIMRPRHGKAPHRSNK